MEYKACSLCFCIYCRSPIDFCSSSGSSSFRPIRTQSIIPTAHVMPSTSGNSPSRLHPPGDPGFSSASVHQSFNTSDMKDQRTVKKWSSLSKLNGLDISERISGESSTDVRTLPADSLNVCRPTLNVLDHSSNPNIEHFRMEEIARKFEAPNLEPTLNQSDFLDTFYGEPNHRLQTCSKAEIPQDVNGTGTKDCYDFTYKSLPESKAVPSNSGLLGQKACFQPNIGGSTTASLYDFQTQQTSVGPSWLREHVHGKTFDTRPNERSRDLTVWQQQQFEALRLQVEHIQLLNAGSQQFPTAQSVILHQEPNKWDPLIKANESILKEKELVIERQKHQIYQLEQKMRMSELQMHSAMLGHPVPLSDVYMLRLQESLRENVFLRAQYAERTEALGNEKTEMEKKLAAAEVEVRRMNETLKENSQKYMDEMKKMEEKVRGRDKHINNLKRKCQKEAEQNREKQQRIETLERYLADLPTLDDYQKQSQQVKDLELKSDQLQSMVTDLETNLGEARALCREKESLLENQKQNEAQLISTVHSLQDKVSKCLEDGARLPILEVEKLQCESDGLKEDYERAKKLIDKQQKRMELLTSQIRSLEDCVAQEEGASQDLREELSGKENGSQQLRRAMKELSAQNQELIEKNLTLQEQLGQSRVGQSTQLPPKTIQLTEKLHRELAKCLSDLQAICNVLAQRAQGKDPNLSLLLGIQSIHHFSAEEEDWQNVDLLIKKLADVKQLHREIDDLRTTISDRYAQDMGDNCITQ
uniref:Centrosomal protein 85 n=1 Tax=Callorhinchus milii TaxID=7868 RepID=A0A4W3K1V8_CALMI